MVSTMIFTSCNENKKEENKTTMENKRPASSGIAVNENHTAFAFSLTVAESKRLIAKGIAIHPLVKQKLKSGMIIITRGTTNTYIAEELAGLDAPRGSLVSGNITPKNTEQVFAGIEKIGEIVLIDGKETDISFKDALEALKKDDIVFKGGNLLNYEKKQAAVTVGAPDGGTVGRIQPYTSEGPAHLIIPIGLEKEVFGDLYDYEKFLSEDIKKSGFIPKLIVHKNAEIFTEIEAIKLFGNVEVIPYASGGIAGSEGAKSFVIYSEPAEIEKVLKIISEIQGETPFIKDI